MCLIATNNHFPSKRPCRRSSRHPFATITLSSKGNVLSFRYFHTMHLTALLDIFITDSHCWPSPSDSHLTSSHSHLTSLVFSLTSHISRLTSHVFSLTSHVLTSSHSHLTSHVFSLTSHVFSLTSHVLTSHISLIHLSSCEWSVGKSTLLLVR